MYFYTEKYKQRWEAEKGPASSGQNVGGIKAKVYFM